VWRAVVCCLALGALEAGELPRWWQAFPQVPCLESAFFQESDSAVFGKLRREGSLKLALGGRLRVEYRKGILLIADGRSLIQYDPEARTAQRLDLRSAAASAPMLKILVNPRTLAESFKVQPGPTANAVTLTPKRQGLPAVVLEGQDNLLKRIRWTDATGAKQLLELKDPHIPAALDPATFTFKAPAGTHWLGTL
jgi:outer membrane lipoprotein-sorting protein